MPKGEGYGNFEETFGSQNEQPYDSSSVMNKAVAPKALKRFLSAFNRFRESPVAVDHLE